MQTRRPKQFGFPFAVRYGLPFALALPFLALLGFGCHDAEYLELRAIRDRRIRHLVESIPELDRNRQVAMTRVLNDAETLRTRRWEHLNQTIIWEEEVEQMRRDRCRRNPLEDEAWFRNVVTGHPEHIRRTWADMVY